MLILTRKPGESLYIGDDIKVTVVEIKGNQVRVGIDASRDKRIYREEIYLQILEENKQAAAAVDSEFEGLEGMRTWQGKGGKLGGLTSSALKVSKVHNESKDKSAPEVVVKRRKTKK